MIRKALDQLVFAEPCATSALISFMQTTSTNKDIPIIGARTILIPSIFRKCLGKRHKKT